MKPRNFFVVIIFAIIFAFYAIFAFAKTTAKTVPEYPTAKVKELLKKIKNEEKLCDMPPRQRPSVCRSKKLILAMDGLLESYLVVQQRANAETTKGQHLKDRIDYLNEEEEHLSELLKVQGYKKEYSENASCARTSLLKQFMLNEGITDNGGVLFQKRPIPGGTGVCWTNAKTKKEGSINFCNYPLAINIETRGGTEKNPIHRKREYIFSLNGCDLLAVHVVDNDIDGERETFLTYDQCMEKWNKRTADAAMSAKDVASMQDTIGFCFREHLLPPRDDKSGRNNPLIRRPADTGPR